METKKTLYQKINQARKDMSMAKDMQNKFGGFNYRSIEQIWERLVPVCEMNKISYSIIEENARTENNLLIIDFKAKFKDLESEEELVTLLSFPMTTFQRVKMDDTQVFGALLSYGRKYLVCRDFQIRAGLQELDADNEINSLRQAISECKTVEELSALKPRLNDIKELQNARELKAFATQKFKELSQNDQPFAKQKH